MVVTGNDTEHYELMVALKHRNSLQPWFSELCITVLEWHASDFISCCWGFCHLILRTLESHRSHLQCFPLPHMCNGRSKVRQALIDTERKDTFRSRTRLNCVVCCHIVNFNNITTTNYNKILLVVIIFAMLSPVMIQMSAVRHLSSHARLSGHLTGSIVSRQIYYLSKTALTTLLTNSSIFSERHVCPLMRKKSVSFGKGGYWVMCKSTATWNTSGRARQPSVNTRSLSFRSQFCHPAMYSSPALTKPREQGDICFAV